jgi:hypothetical protein
MNFNLRKALGGGPVYRSRYSTSDLKMSVSVLHTGTVLLPLCQFGGMGGLGDAADGWRAGARC